MKYLFLLIFLMINKNIFALEMSCLFEEVYQNGEAQQGLLIVKNDKFRYQYFSKDLYTIIYNESLFFYLQNRDKTKFYRLKQNTEALEIVISIINDFPNIKDQYYLENTLVKVEKSNSSKIAKRIVILSNDLNMSIYIKDCKNNLVKNRYFSYSPFWEYKP